MKKLEFTKFGLLFLTLFLLSSVSAIVLEEHSGTYDTDIEIGAYDLAGQSINASSTYTVNWVSFLMRWQGTSSATNFTVSLQGDNSGEPNGTVLCTSSEINVSTLTQTIGGEWVNFELSSCPEISLGTQYWVVFDGVASNLPNIQLYGIDGGSGYSEGLLKQHFPGPIPPASWTDDTSDAFFKIYDSEGPASNSVTSVTLSPVDQTNVVSSGVQTFTGVAVGSIVDEGLVSCTYSIYRGGNTLDGVAGSGSFSGTDCTFQKSFSSTADNGVWWWTIMVDDGVNTPVSSSAKINVNLPGLGGGNIPISGTTGDGATQGSFFWGFMILIVLAIVTIGIFLKKRN